jgi:NAD(P)-dependent dehydrogenase (short-subunit alcohol dehydrogenase family)
MTETASGAEHRMADQPHDEMADYTGSGLLLGKAALITGGDSGIGRAVAVAFAKEGADVAIAYFQQDEDAQRTAELVKAAGGRCLAVRGDIADPDHRRDLVEQVVAEFGSIDVLVNNAAVQEPMSIEEMTLDHWRRTFAVNLEPVFFLTQDVLLHMPDGGAIINTASITGLRGHKELLDYSATKGAIITLTMTLAQALVDRRIRVNAIAPGPVWTPLIPATFPPEKVESFGTNTPFGRPAQPDEIAPSYVFFASDRLSSYYSGEVLAPVGGPGQVTR